jgi:hypothetical protein
MTKPSRHRMDRDTAERLLTRVPGGLVRADRRIAQLLAAASAPARPAELGGMEDAVSAFGRLFHTPRPRPWRMRMLRTTLTRVVTVKLLAVTVTVAGVGGVALAATTGSLPGPAQDAAHSAFGAPPAHPAPRASTGAPQHPNSSPSPSLPGLCQAYLAHPVDERGKAVESPAFTALVTAAGGPEKVEDYCATLTPGHPSATPSHPGGATTDKSPPSHPTGPPTQPGPPTDPPAHP